MSHCIQNSQTKKKANKIYSNAKVAYNFGKPFLDAIAAPKHQFIETKLQNMWKHNNKDIFTLEYNYGDLTDELLVKYGGFQKIYVTFNFSNTDYTMEISLTGL